MWCRLPNARVDVRVVCVVSLGGERSDAEHFYAHAEGLIVLVLFLSSSM